MDAGTNPRTMSLTTSTKRTDTSNTTRTLSLTNTTIHHINPNLITSINPPSATIRQVTPSSQFLDPILLPSSCNSFFSLNSISTPYEMSKLSKRSTLRALSTIYTTIATIKALPGSALLKDTALKAAENIKWGLYGKLEAKSVEEVEGIEKRVRREMAVVRLVLEECGGVVDVSERGTAMVGDGGKKEGQTVEANGFGNVENGDNHRGSEKEISDDEASIRGIYGRDLDGASDDTAFPVMGDEDWYQDWNQAIQAQATREIIFINELILIRDPRKAKNVELGKQSEEEEGVLEMKHVVKKAKGREELKGFEYSKHVDEKKRGLEMKPKAEALKDFDNERPSNDLKPTKLTRPVLHPHHHTVSGLQIPTTNEPPKIDFISPTSPSSTLSLSRMMPFKANSYSSTNTNSKEKENRPPSSVSTTNLNTTLTHSHKQKSEGKLTRLRSFSSKLRPRSSARSSSWSKSTSTPDHVVSGLIAMPWKQERTVLEAVQGLKERAKEHMKGNANASSSADTLVTASSSSESVKRPGWWRTTSAAGSVLSFGAPPSMI